MGEGWGDPDAIGTHLPRLYRGSHKGRGGLILLGALNQLKGVLGVNASRPPQLVTYYKNCTSRGVTRHFSAVMMASISATAWSRQLSRLITRYWN